VSKANRERSFDELSGHEATFHNRVLTLPYDYDPTEDGPEVRTICCILASGALAEDKSDRLSV